MFKRIRQYNYIMKIRKAMTMESMIKYLHLNNIKSKAARDCMYDRITTEFYKDIFLGGNMSHHYIEVNKEKILNYKF